MNNGVNTGIKPPRNVLPLDVMDVKKFTSLYDWKGWTASLQKNSIKTSPLVYKGTPNCKKLTEFSKNYTPTLAPALQPFFRHQGFAPFQIQSIGLDKELI